MEPDNAEDGANMAVVPLTVTVPLTGFIVLSFSVKVVTVMVLAFIDSLKVAVSAEEIDTPVAPLAGIVALKEEEPLLPISVVPVTGELRSQERSTEATMSPNAA